MACDSPLSVRTGKGIDLKTIPVPCGRCPQCKIRRVNDWVFRLLQEDKISESAIFLTLTYDPTEIKRSRNNFPTLCKRDFQLFMKRLRKRLPESRIKYYAVGEYGTQTRRPHYHAILFNCDDYDTISESWKLGHIHIGNVTSDSIAYTLKYIDKESTVPLHARDDREKEFSLMSKNLGKSYLTPQILTFHRSHPNDLRVQKNEHKISMPRYYREKIWTQSEREQQIPFIEQGVKHSRAMRKLDYDQNINYEGIEHYQYEALQKEGRFNKFNRLQNQKRNKL